jgi:hypothetical protein
LAHGILFATGELVYVQGLGNKPDEAGGGLSKQYPGAEVRLSSQKLPARLTKIPVHRGVAPYAIILLLIFSPLQREPHGPNIINLAIVLLLSVLIYRMIGNFSVSH